MPEAREASRKGRPRRAAEVAEDPLATCKKNAARKGAVILFEDEVGFSQQGTTIRTWAPIGDGAIVDSEPGRRSIKAFGAVECSEAPRLIHRFGKRLNGATFARFLQQILEAIPDRFIYVVLDNVAYHRAAEVRQLLREMTPQRLHLVALPPYSPELNPIEFVWRETKRRATHNRYFPVLESLRDAVRRQFARFGQNPSLLRGAASLYL